MDLDNIPQAGQPIRYKRKTLAGRILKGIGFGVVDAFPIVSQIVNTVNADKVVHDIAKPARAVSGITSLLVVVVLVAKLLRPELEVGEILPMLLQLLL